MNDISDELRLSLTLMISTAAFTAPIGPTSTTDAVITFSYQADGVRCDGEVSLRLSLDD